MMHKLLHLFFRFLKTRYFRWKYKLTKVHSTFYMGGKSNLSSDLIAGPYSYIGPNCLIYPGVTIGAYTMLANNVSIIGKDHKFNQPGIPIIFSGREELKTTKIGNDVWIGAFTLIMAGITIGDGTIVAAGSVVTKNLDSYSIYAGVPTKKIRDRFNSPEDVNIHKKMLALDPSNLDEKIKHYAPNL